MPKIQNRGHRSVKNSKKNGNTEFSQLTSEEKFRRTVERIRAVNPEKLPERSADLPGKSDL